MAECKNIRKNEWFEKNFLQSIIEKANANSKKYKNCVILTEKQYFVCEQYMELKMSYGDYGYFYNLVYKTNTHSFIARQEGKYNFMYVYKI